MATAIEVIGALHSRGVTLEPDGTGGLRVNGISRLADREKAALKAHKASLIKDLSHPTATGGSEAVAPATVVTAPLPACTELPEPVPKDRLCYQCAHFDRSPYGFPLGLCRQYGLPEGLFSDARGNRIQHAASRPAQFGCVDFSLRAPDTHFCTACRHYHTDTTMCRVVNLGCPYPAIPPCSGARFEPGEARA